MNWISAHLERRFSQADEACSPARSHRAAAPPRRSRFTALNAGGFTLAAATLAVAVTIGVREGRAPELAEPSATAPAVRCVGNHVPLSCRRPGRAAQRPALGAADRRRVVFGPGDGGRFRRALERGDSRGEHRPPSALRAPIVPGKPLLWEVVAKDAAGRAVASVRRTAVQGPDARSTRGKDGRHRDGSVE